MAHKGQTGTSMGGAMVTRKGLKAQQRPELPPVDPDTLNAVARARREAYLAEQAERYERARAAAEAREQRKAARDAAARARGLRVVSAADAVRRDRYDARRLASRPF